MLLGAALSISADLLSQGTIQVGVFVQFSSLLCLLFFVQVVFVVF